jgi:hypothetical protein
VTWSKPTRPVRSTYFERRLVKDARFCELRLERDIQPRPYPSGWLVRVLEGGARYGEARGLMGMRALTGPRLPASASFGSRRQAEAYFKTAVATAKRAGYAEIRSRAKRAFVGYSARASSRGFVMKRPIAPPKR